MNALRLAQLRGRTPQYGTWLSIGSPVIAELAAASGFDWLLIDLEHGCGGEAALLPQLQAIDAAGGAGDRGPAAIVRVGAPHPDLILRVLDWGADGIMVPHVSTAEEAKACVRAVHYPPRGARGFSRSARTYGYGLHPPGSTEPLPSPLIVAQIESIEGVENACRIAGVEGVDVLFVGPADLRFDLSARASAAVRDYEGCLQEVAAAAAEAQKGCGILLRNPAELHRHRQLGFTHLAIDSDLAILRNGFRNLRGIQA